MQRWATQIRKRWHVGLRSMAAGVSRVRLGMMGATLAKVAVTAVAATSGHAAAAATSDLSAPVQLTREQDHQRLIDLLHISELRPGPDGNPTAPNAANFDESKVAPYSLPDPLVLKNGQRVTTSSTWWRRRRPEIVADFDSEMYGRVPENVPKVTWQVVHSRHETLGNVPVVTKDIVGHLDNSAYPLIAVDIQLTLTTPEKAAGPVPVIMELNLGAAAQAALRKRFTDEQWAVFQGTGPSWQSQVLSKGWGYAILIPTSVQADNGEGLTQGVIGLTNRGQPRKPGEWGALRAWAWSASRAVDYFETNQSVDARQIGKKDLGVTEFPPPETELIDGDIGFRQHRAGHTTGPNWPTFLTFASRYSKGSPHNAAGAAANDLGLFEGQSDIGDVRPPGTGGYSAVAGAYTLTSAGSNTWYHVDNFHYLWKKASGNVSLTANVTFPPQSYPHEPNPHRKGILMFRQTLDAGGIYADVGVHGSGMTALQYRRALGANTEDIELNTDAPQTVRLEKRGDTFTLFLSMKGEPLHQVGASVTMHLEEPFYVGLGAVSHDVSTTDEVRFSNVTVQALAVDAADAPGNSAQAKVSLYSTLRTIQTEDQFRRAMVIRSVPAYMQSPNWASDGKTLYVHEDGHIEKIPLLTPEAGGTPQRVSLGNLVDCSGNFGLSPDRKWLAVSCAEKSGGQHDVYVVAASRGSGTPRKITQGTLSSFFHAWSPDSQTIAFTRGSAGNADIFAIAVTGGTEMRLTSDTVNDGPDYSPDGKLIYFDSARSGSTQIWHMKPDGSGAEQVTDDDNINSSPHVSPDGKTIAFLSQPAAGGGVGIGDAELKVFSINDGLIRTLASFQGDRGSFSMYGWGDANHVAFISYQFLPTEVEGSR